MSVTIPEEKKVRVIVNTDAKNEVDDQFAIVHALRNVHCSHSSREMIPGGRAAELCGLVWDTGDCPKTENGLLRAEALTTISKKDIVHG